MGLYLEQVQKGMDLLAAHEKTIFVGQATKFKGHAVSRQLVNYSDEKKIEFPVAEDFQAGFCLGLSLQGYIPVCIYPRHDFLILALNQILNHIDRWALMDAGFPKVIIKALVGAKKPLDGGHQHTADYFNAIKSMCQTITCLNLKKAEDVFPAYEKSLNEPGPFIISEYTELY